jgi:hypothetical protein
MNYKRVHDYQAGKMFQFFFIEFYQIKLATLKKSFYSY